MKLTLNMARIIVGVLFIFSGLIKANDPLGLSYKMQEFFEIWGWDFLHNYTLMFSVLMNAFEIIAGFAVLLGWRMNIFSWLLLLLIIFFTFLTGYAYLSGKVRECGCFGNCIPLQAKESFIKDIILLVLILFIFAFRKRIEPVFRNGLSIFLLSVITFASFGFQWYTLTYLPVMDCLPYKVGNNVPAKMQPTGTRPDKFDFTFIYQKNGQQKEVKMSELGQMDSTWTFVDRKQVLVEKGDMKEPEIKDFSLHTMNDFDTTEAIVNHKGYIVIFFVKDISESSQHLNQAFGNVLVQAGKQEMPVVVASSTFDEVNNYFNVKNHFNLPVLKLDGVAFKTAARANPTVYILESGNIRGKWSYANFEEAARFIQKTYSPK